MDHRLSFRRTAAAHNEARCIDFEWKLGEEERWPNVDPVNPTTGFKPLSTTDGTAVESISSEFSISTTAMSVVPTSDGPTPLVMSSRESIKSPSDSDSLMFVEARMDIMFLCVSRKFYENTNIMFYTDVTNTCLVIQYTFKSVKNFNMSSILDSKPTIWDAQAHYNSWLDKNQLISRRLYG